MKILIFEDDTYEFDCLKTNIDSFFRRKNIEYEILRIYNVNDLLLHIYNYDIVFLDIELNEENGIEIGIKIRTYNKSIKIIFVTNFTQYLIDGYKAHADRYFLKPIEQKQFDIEMDTVIEDYIQNNSGFIDTKLSPNMIYYKDILYIECINNTRKTTLHMINGNNHETTHTLKYWLDKLQEFPFCQSYKSIIVNLNCVSGFKRNDLILINDEIIPLSRIYKKSFYEANIKNLHKRM